MTLRDFAMILKHLHSYFRISLENCIRHLLTSGELGSPPATHSTRLKDEILAEISDLQFHREGKQGYFASIQKFSNSNEIESKTLRDALRIPSKSG